MSNNSIELDVRRETPRKQVPEEYVLPVVGTDGRDASATTTDRPAKTRKQKVAANIQFVSCCVPLFLAGWNDGTLGPLLPRIQTVYNVNFTVVSLLFVLACVGFFSGALINVPLSDKLGFGKVIVLGSLFQIVAYTLMAPALPFPALVVAYAINGVGVALQDAQANGYVASLDSNAEAKMGVLHAVYGAGALCAPLVATQFAQQKRWSFHFLASLGLAVTNTVVLIAIFKFKTQDECLAEIGQVIPERTENEQSANNKGKFRQIMGHRTVQFLAFFILFYVGVEVTIGGWIVTYIIQERHGGPSSGYISAGFFGGLMVGRVALLWVNEKVNNLLINSLFLNNPILQDRRTSRYLPLHPTSYSVRPSFLFPHIRLITALDRLEIVIWFVPSLIGNAIAVSIVGVILGPMYPIAMNHAGRVLPRWILTGSIGWIAGFGQTGSAILPFMTGAISNKYGIKSLQPLLVAMMGLLIVLWAIVPGHRRPD
ncbi:hypothetical protein DXG01_002716 [Tephrocybe rancida]|nr:hypothetical protein DXG01_002716 [Tephrocybe rancida]